MAHKEAIKSGVEMGLIWFYKHRFGTEESMEAACETAVSKFEELETPEIAALRSLANSWEREVTGHYTGSQETEEAMLKCVGELRALLAKLQPVKRKSERPRLIVLLPSRADIKWIPGRDYSTQLDEHYDALHAAYLRLANGE